MKLVCERCLFPDRSAEACRKRQCKDSDYTPPQPPPPYVSPWHLYEDEVIGDDSVKLLIIDVNEEDGSFTAQVVHLDDKEKSPRHYGSYISKGQYYHFDCVGAPDKNDKNPSNIFWTIPDIGTDRFHREGSCGAQFVLYWFDDKGFCFDLDS